MVQNVQDKLIKGKQWSNLTNENEEKTRDKQKKKRKEINTGYIV